jgi:hypothetical protein
MVKLVNRGGQFAASLFYGEHVKVFHSTLLHFTYTVWSLF